MEERLKQASSFAADATADWLKLKPAGKRLKITVA
jgi:hypothetical protein